MSSNLEANIQYNCQICFDSQLCNFCNGNGGYEKDIGYGETVPVICDNCNNGYCPACTN